MRTGKGCGVPRGCDGAHWSDVRQVEGRAVRHVRCPVTAVQQLLQTEVILCLWCGDPAPKGTRRPRKTCGDLCRKRASRWVLGASGTASTVPYQGSPLWGAP